MNSTKKVILSLKGAKIKERLICKITGACQLQMSRLQNFFINTDAKQRWQVGDVRIIAALCNLPAADYTDAANIVRNNFGLTID